MFPINKILQTMTLYKSPSVLLRVVLPGTHHVRSVSSMRLLQVVSADGKPSVAAEIDGDGLVDLSAANSTIPRSLLQFIKAGDRTVDEARRILSQGRPLLDRSSIRILAPLPRPGKVACVGLNYLQHCQELGLSPPPVPVVFSKFSSCVVGPMEDVVYPTGISELLDWEAELAVVIGRVARNVQVDRAMEYVFGYTVANDLSARDLFKPDFNAGQWMVGKSLDCFCPLGPAVVTKDEISDPHNLNIVTRVNGQVKQTGNTNDMIHRIASIIGYMSKFFTLYPGDVILTGTPPGAGHFKSPPEYLKIGDVVECEIERIGKLQNKIVEKKVQEDYSDLLL